MFEHFPSSSEVAIFSWQVCLRTVLNRMKNHVSFFRFSIFYLWLIVLTIYYYVASTSKCVTNQKKSCSKVAKFTENAHCLENDFIFLEFIFCAILVFYEIWSILYMVDFDDVTSCCDLTVLLNSNSRGLW